jgi:hypothetical protein
MTTKIISHIIKGLIISAALITVSLVLQHLKTPSATWQWLPTLLLVIGVAASCLVFFWQAEETPKFGAVFAHGFRTTAVITCLMALYTFITVRFIFPHSSPDEIDAAAKAIRQQGNLMTQEAKEQAIAAAKNSWIMAVSGVIFVTVISGLAGSLAGAGIARAFTRRNQ